MTPHRFLVVGAGAIGGVVSAHLVQQGHDVVATTTNRAIADAIASRGLHLIEYGERRSIPLRVLLSPPAGEPFDWIILATQPPDVEAAARTAAPHLAPGGRFVCLQNGLCEERVAAFAGPDRVVGAIVAFGASIIEPGTVERTSAGGFALGWLPGAPDARIEDLARALEATGPVQLTSNLRGARWSKLAINCAISSLGTIGGDRLGPLMRHRFVRRLALEVMSEVVAVARAERVALEKVSGTLDLDWIALTDAERRAPVGSPGLVAKHALLLAVGQRYRRMRSSMLSAIERGRTPAVDFLNGEVVSRGHHHAVPTPLNARIQALVHDLAAHRRVPALATLQALFDATRAEPASAPTSAL